MEASDVMAEDVNDALLFLSVSCFPTADCQSPLFKAKLSRRVQKNQYPRGLAELSSTESTTHCRRGETQRARSIFGGSRGLIGMPTPHLHSPRNDLSSNRPARNLLSAHWPSPVHLLALSMGHGALTSDGVD